jgi:hypothetical protein
VTGPQDHEPYWETTEPYHPFTDTVTRPLHTVDREPTQPLPRIGGRRPGSWATALSVAVTAALIVGLAVWVWASSDGPRPAPAAVAPSLITRFPTVPAEVVTLPPGLATAYRAPAPVAPTARPVIRRTPVRAATVTPTPSASTVGPAPTSTLPPSPVAPAPGSPTATPTADLGGPGATGGVLRP